MRSEYDWETGGGREALRQSGRVVFAPGDWDGGKLFSLGPSYRWVELKWTVSVRHHSSFSTEDPFKSLWKDV